MPYIVYNTDEDQEIYFRDMIPGIDVVNRAPNKEAMQGNVTDLNQMNDVATQLNELAMLHNTRLAMQGGIATGTGDDEGKKNPVYTVRKPWLDAPDGALPFDPQTSVALPAVGAGVVVVTHAVPDGYDGVINAYSWNFTGGGFVEGSGDIVVQVRRNGVAIRNYEAITVEKGSIQIPRPIAPLRIYSKDVIDIFVTHAANNLLNGNVVGSLVGYDYPSEG